MFLAISRQGPLWQVSDLPHCSLFARLLLITQIQLQALHHLLGGLAQLTRSRILGWLEHRPQHIAVFAIDDEKVSLPSPASVHALCAGAKVQTSFLVIRLLVVIG